MCLCIENRAGPSNLGNVISQILLCKQITPDFNQEELCSISKDSAEISKILKEMQEYMPKQENNLGECGVCRVRLIMLASSAPNQTSYMFLTSQSQSYITTTASWQKHSLTDKYKSQNH